jgi:DNA-binding IclR family transcriptional regulator
MTAPKTVIKALGLLEHIRANPGQRVSELAIASGVPIPTCSRLLEALSEARLIRRRNGLYELGPHCLALAESFREVFNLNNDARVHLESLALQTGETAHIGVLDDAECVYVDKVDSAQSVRMYSKVGARSPLHSSGIGKALLSAAPAEVFDRVCEKGLARRTSSTITDPKRLRVEIDSIMVRGYSIDDVENEEGIRCVAAPIRGADGFAVGAVSVAGPDYRLAIDLVPAIGIQVMAVANELASLVGFIGEPLGSIST